MARFNAGIFGATGAAGKELIKVLADRKYPVEVGRIRQSQVFKERGIDFFVSGDQLLRGAALNAVLIAEALIHAGKLVPRGTK